MLESIVIYPSLESWAGAVADTDATAARLGVTRTKLREWLKAGRVIRFGRVDAEPVYPLEQFVDGRPIKGLGKVVAIAPTPRTAWMWLRQPFWSFGGRTPLEALCNGELAAVVEVSHRLFDPG